jgi:hypothetical protein
VDEAQTPQGISAQGVIAKFGYKYARGIAHDYVADDALTGDKDAQLPSDGMGYLGHKNRNLAR